MATAWEFTEDPPFDVRNTTLLPGTIGLWQTLQQQLPIGSLLTGTIFARTIFAVFFDAGIGFPVRMNVTDFGKAERIMTFPTDYFALGSEISGNLAGFDISLHQLVVVRQY